MAGNGKTLKREKKVVDFNKNCGKNKVKVISNLPLFIPVFSLSEK